jgi:hypothetical protein
MSHQKYDPRGNEPNVKAYAICTDRLLLMYMCARHAFLVSSQEAVSFSLLVGFLTGPLDPDPPPIIHPETPFPSVGDPPPQNGKGKTQTCLIL